MSYRIGELAAKLDLPVETIRYYEREGLLPAPQRTAGNYRVYDDVQFERLSFICNCRALDMNLEEVRALLTLRDAPEKECLGVNELLDAHIAHVSERIAELRRLKTQLKGLREQCLASSAVEQCGILNGLSAIGAGKTVRRRRSHTGKVHSRR